MTMRTVISTLLLGGVASALPLLAQSGARESHEVDAAVTYSATRINGTAGGSTWGQGASLDLSAEAYHGLGAALVVSSTRATNLGGSNINLTQINVMAGPRYTLRRQRLAVFGEGLLGEANGFDSLFPAQGGAIASANSLAVQVGGGVDFSVGKHFAVRAVEASWLRTQLPNASTNVQNSLQVGAGVVFRLQR